MLAVRTTKNDEPAQVNDFATAATFPLVRMLSIIGAGVATYACVSPATDDPSPVTRRPGIVGGETARRAVTIM
jgi:hypothetical protein